MFYFNVMSFWTGSREIQLKPYDDYFYLNNIQSNI
jgi:hypothetical protein